MGAVSASDVDAVGDVGKPVPLGDDLPLAELHRRMASAEARLLELTADLDRARAQLRTCEDQLTVERSQRGPERDAVLDQLADEQAQRADLLRRLHLEEDERFAVAAQLESERAAFADLEAERDELLEVLAGAQLAEARWVALERWHLVRLYRLAKRLRRG